MTRRADDLWVIAQRELTPKQLEAFTLHYRAELTQTDIAHHLNITRQAVSERLRKAELRIAQALRTRKAAA